MTTTLELAHSLTQARLHPAHEYVQQREVELAAQESRRLRRLRRRSA